MRRGIYAKHLLNLMMITYRGYPGRIGFFSCKGEPCHHIVRNGSYLTWACLIVLKVIGCFFSPTKYWWALKRVYPKCFGKFINTQVWLQMSWDMLHCPPVFPTREAGKKSKICNQLLSTTPPATLHVHSSKTKSLLHQDDLFLSFI